MSEYPTHDGCAIAACTVTKAQLLRFIGAKFQMAHRDRDGELSIPSLAISFVSTLI